MSKPTAHPAPSAMAREAYPGLNGDGWDDLREACETGVELERARIAAWLREQSAYKVAETNRVRGPNYTAEDHRFTDGRVSAFKDIALLDDALEGKRRCRHCLQAIGTPHADTCAVTHDAQRAGWRGPPGLVTEKWCDN